MPIAICFSILIHFSVSQIMNKIFSKTLKNKILFMLPIALFLLYVPLTFISTGASIIYHFLVQLFSIFILARCYNVPYFSSFKTYLFICLMNIVISAPIINIFNIPQSMTSVVEVCISILIFLSTIIIANLKIAYKIQNIILWMSRGTKNFLLILLSLCVLCLSLIMDKEYYSANFDNWIIFISSFIAIFTIVTALAFPIMIIYSSTNRYLQRLNQQYIKQIDFQTNHYKSMAKSNYELRKFRHDYKNKMTVLAKMLKDNNMETAIELIDSYNLGIKEATTNILPFDTGNEIADAMLQEKQNLIKDKNIEISFSGAISKNYIKPNDLCIILGNALDNAIEACEKAPKDTKCSIVIESVCNNGFMFLKIQNPVFEKVEIKNNHISTTKKGKYLHGYGLVSIRDTVSKYDGAMSLSCDNNIFTLEIDLSLNI